jgi:hypothetical protein
MEFNEALPAIVALLMIGLLFYAAYSSITKNKFDDVKETIFSSDLHLSHGTVHKSKETNGFRYFLQYNLPNTETPLQTTDLDKPFNDTGSTKLEYKVYLGKDLDTMKYVGNLQREVTGFYILEHYDLEDYKKACVFLNTTQVSCLDI